MSSAAPQPANFAASPLRTSKADDLVVSLESAIESYLDIHTNPELVVLEVECERSACNNKIDLDDHALFQVAIDRPDADANDANCDRDLESAGINVSGDLFTCFVS
jgi:hypothetical protein